MLTRKDLAATAVTLAVVLAFAATHEHWAVPLIGDSHRWATGAILLLGSLNCGLGSRSAPAGNLLPVLGMLAFVLALLAIATASLTPLSLLVGDLVLMWAVATFRHARRGSRHVVSVVR
jgi:hypothetical protein